MLLHHHFVKTAKKQGSTLAFVDRTADRKISYSKALIGSLILADRFRTAGQGFLGIMLPTSAGCSLAILGAMMGGRTPVMINYSTGAEKNVLYAQKKCDFKTVITSRALIEKIGCPEMEGMVFLEDIMKSLSMTEKLKAAFKSKLPASFITGSLIHRGDVNDTIVILFTSGSEKEPKAVQLTHKNIASNIASFSRVYLLTEDDSMLANLPFFHVFGLTVNFWTPLYHGMTLVTYANPLDYKAVCDILRTDKPTMMVGTPSFFWGYLRKSEPGDFASLKYAVSGADKCPDALREGFLQKHGMTLYEGYGATETSPVIAVNSPSHNRPGSVGRPLPEVAVRIENYETGADCPVGEVGRIMVSGDLVMKGYLNDFEETSMRIRHGWYDTGDMGCFDAEGYLWHAGRLKRFVKIGGEMVSLVHTESVLERLLPEDVHCCVVDVPDPYKGSRIVATVTAPVDEKTLIRKMAEQLPNIALPKQFIVIAELPKMGSGKIDFRAASALVIEMLHQQKE